MSKKDEDDFNYDIKAEKGAWGEDESSKKLFRIIIGLHLVLIFLTGMLYLLTFVDPYSGYINKFISLAIG